MSVYWMRQQEQSTRNRNLFHESLMICLDTCARCGRGSTLDRVKMRFLITVLLFGLLNFAPSQPALARPRVHTYPIRLAFDQASVAGKTWQGSVSGDLTGVLNSDLRSLYYHARSWQVEFKWTVEATDPAHSFTAELTGTINPKTRYMNLMGTVTKGWLTDAQIHVNGKITDLRMRELKGTIYLTPALVLDQADEVKMA
jgi:hypothetical protein